MRRLANDAFERGVLKAFKIFGAALKPIVAETDFVEGGADNVQAIAVMQALITLGAKVAQWNGLPRETFQTILGGLMADSANPESDIFLEARTKN